MRLSGAALSLVLVVALVGPANASLSEGRCAPENATPAKEATTQDERRSSEPTELTGGWALRSASSISDGGATISRPGYGTAGWSPISLPATVLAGLVDDNVYQNIFFGENLKSVPDLTTQDWCYRGEFVAAPALPGQEYWLRFKELSYRAAGPGS